MTLGDRMANGSWTPQLQVHHAPFELWKVSPPRSG
jgi:hypothetical protein